MKSYKQVLREDRHNRDFQRNAFAKLRSRGASERSLVDLETRLAGLFASVMNDKRIPPAQRQNKAIRTVNLKIREILTKRGI